MRKRILLRFRDSHAAIYDCLLLLLLIPTSSFPPSPSSIPFSLPVSKLALKWGAELPGVRSVVARRIFVWPHPSVFGVRRYFASTDRVSSERVSREHILEPRISLDYSEPRYRGKFATGLM